MAIQDLGGRREGQKFKSLLVWQILLRHTDENHPLSAEKIVELLEDEYGVTSGEYPVCPRTGGFPFIPTIQFLFDSIPKYWYTKIGMIFPLV